jgi:hypothetical protein
MQNALLQYSTECKAQLCTANSYRGVLKRVRVDCSDIALEVRVFGAVRNSFHRFQNQAATGLGVVHRRLAERGGDELHPWQCQV